MSAAYVQRKANATASAVTLDITFDAATASGNLIVVYNALGSTTRSISSVTDTQGNTYQRAGTIQRCSEASVDVWYAYAITGGATTITVTMDAETGYWYVTCTEWSGLLTTRDPYHASVGYVNEDPSWPISFPALSVPTDAALVLVCAYDGTVITTEPTNTDNITAYGGRNLWYYLQPTAGDYTATIASADGTIIAGLAIAFLTEAPEYWVDVADFVDPEIPAAFFPGGVARVLGEIWSEDIGSPLPVLKSRLVSLLTTRDVDGKLEIDAEIGRSAEVSSAVPASNDFSVTLVGTKRHKLQVTSDPLEVDVFWMGRGVGP